MSSLASLIEREPVRVYLYSALTAIVAVLVAYGVIDAERAPVILAVVSAIFAVPAVEAARSKVSPVTKNEDGSL